MRSRTLRRFAILIALLAAVYGVGFAGYGFTAGADEYLGGKPRSADCQTPKSRFGWTYEAVNYDLADDATLLAANAKLTNCANQGSPVGAEVVAPDGVHLAAWYIPAAHAPVRVDPSAPTGPTVVIVHGGKANKSGMLAYAAAFHDTYNVLVVDLRNSGRSGDADSTGGLHEQADLRAMIDWLVRAKDPSWVAVMGNSNGASTALAEALGDSRVKALILDSMHASVERQVGNVIATEKGLPEWPGAWGLVAGVSYQLGESVETVDPIRTIVRLHDRPILLTHGLADVIDRPADSLERNVAAATAAGIDIEVHTCIGAGHGEVVTVCSGDWARWVLTFLAEHGGASG
ncbi:MAG: alpha/beta fold hydrolase [Candidatus Limnocylindrales bacterium]